MASVEEQIVELASFIHKGLQEESSNPQSVAYSDTVVQLQKERKYTDVWAIFMEEFDLIFSLGTERDTETCFKVMFHLLPILQNEVSYDVLKMLAEKFTERILKAEDKSDKLRWKILLCLFDAVNALPESWPISFQISLSLLRFSLEKTFLTEAIALMARVENCLKAKKSINVESKSLSDFFDLARQIYEQIEDKKSVAHHYLLKLLATLDGSEYKKDIRPKLVEKAIMNCFFLPGDLNAANSEMSLIRTFDSTQEFAHSNPKVFELFGIVASRDYDRYLAYEKENTATIESVGLKVEDLAVRMRFATLSRLFEGGFEIPLDNVNEAIHTTDEGTEEWICRAIKAGYCHGKIDSIGRVFYPSQARFHSSNGVADWKTLHGVLCRMRDNVGEMLALMESARSREDPMPF